MITLTHLCYSWRDTFTSRSSLWTQLDFGNIEKTRTYIQRSQDSPFKICLGPGEVKDDAFSPIISHIRRLKSLTICAGALPGVIRHFRCHTSSTETSRRYASYTTGQLKSSTSSSPRLSCTQFVFGFGCQIHPMLRLSERYPYAT